MESDTIEVIYDDNFPEKIKAVRQQRGITQRDLAKKAKVAQQTISALENGKLDPSLKILLAVAGILGIILIIKSVFKEGGEKS